MERRIKTMLFIMLFFLAILLGRIYYIQIICQNELKEGAQGQQIIPIENKNKRGIIYDRNLVRLTNKAHAYYYLVKKESDTLELKSLIGRISGEAVGRKGENYIVYKTEIFNSSINERLVKDFGAYAFCVGSRYEDKQIAAHLIGSVSEEGRIGVSGLEQMFQYKLSAEPAVLSMMGDGAGQPIPGIGLSEEQKKKRIRVSGLITTIDEGLQTQVEKILQEDGISGSVVVTHVKTGEVFAMASSPSFSPNHLERHLASEEGELVNKSVSGTYPPGSVFKIAVAAAALESGKFSPEYTYECKGSITVNGVKLVCGEKTEGHGKIDFGQAMAQSCNCYFAHMGQQLGAETIIDMAKKLGFGSEVLEKFPDEEKGNLPAPEERVFSGISNLAIGQGSLLVTPIQVAKMTEIIAAKGISRQMTVVMDDREGQTEEEQVISEKTAREIGEMMIQVMEEGTGRNITSDIGTAGKTGSAETSFDGEDAVHGWFTGFFPEKNPEYTVTVLVEKGNTGSGSALPVFEKIVDFLY